MLKKNITKLSRLILANLHIVVPLIITFFVGLWLTHIYRDAINPDGTSYFEIAKYYAQGDFKIAVNGYWAPLLSWLLAPFAFLKLDLPLMYRLLSVVIVSSYIFFLTYFQRNYVNTGIRRVSLVVYMSAFGISMVTWAIQLVTPDVLSGIILSLSLLSLWRLYVKQTFIVSMLSGILLSLNYFSKSIGLYLSIIAIAYMLIFAFFKKRQAVRGIFIASIIFIILSSIWILCLSLKYGELTVATASKYNHALAGPSSEFHPQTINNRLLLPNNDQYFWAWVDPGGYKVKDWHELEHPRYAVNRFLSNLSQSTIVLLMIQPLLFIALYCAFRKHNNPYIIMIFLISVATVGAYSTLWVEARYFWLIVIPILCIPIFTPTKTYRQSVYVGLSIFLGLVSLYPLIQISQESNVTKNSSMQQKTVAIKLTSVLPKGTKVVTSSHDDFVICFYASLRCRGLFSLDDPAQSTSQQYLYEIKQASIKYYVSHTPVINNGLRLIQKISAAGYSCYDMKNDKTIECPGENIFIYELI